MKTSHTPGPWSANHSELEACSPIVEIRTAPNGDYLICQSGFQNARLIATAPELLASLIAIYEMVPFDVPESDPRVTTAMELILKLTQP